MKLPESQNDTTLPEDFIYSEILPKLPAKSLLRFKSVSKEWHELISNNSNLKKSHARHHTAPNSPEVSAIIRLDSLKSNPEELWLFSGKRQTLKHLYKPELKEQFHPYDYMHQRIVHLHASSNGLVLFSPSRNEPLRLWNPATREYRILPEPIIKHTYYSSILDLGFDNESDDHKVFKASNSLQIDSDLNRIWLVRFQVFSMRSDSWRELRALPETKIFSFDPCVSASIGGIIYFLVKQGKSLKRNYVILSFTYSDEEVRHVINAPEFNSKLYDDLQLCRWKENSLAFLVDDATRDHQWDFWVMIKNDDDNGTSSEFFWSKLFVFNGHPTICGLWSERYLIINKWSHRMSKLVLRDAKNNCIREKEICSFQDCLFCIIEYVPTLISVYPDR